MITPLLPLKGLSIVQGSGKVKEDPPLCVHVFCARLRLLSFHRLGFNDLIAGAATLKNNVMSFAPPLLPEIEWYTLDAFKTQMQSI